MSINQAVADAINDQIRMELASAYVYMAMSAWFERENLPGFAHWMRLQSKEEVEHAEKLYEHMIDRGGTIVFKSLDAPPGDFGTVRQAVEQAAAHEAKVTASIHALYETAGGHKEYATQTMLHWFIDEQVEEERNAADLRGRLDLVESGKGSLLMIDKELAGRSADD